MTAIVQDFMSICLAVVAGAKTALHTCANSATFKFGQTVSKDMKREKIM